MPVVQCKQEGVLLCSYYSITRCYISSSQAHMLWNYRSISVLVRIQGRVSAGKSTQLVPGDVIVVQTGQAVCDMVLLQGNALTEESRLTGQVILS